MRKIRISTIGLALLSGAATAQAAAPKPWTLDQASTRITFDVGAVGMADTHGRFRRIDGRLAFDLDHPEASSVMFTVAAASVDVDSDAIDQYLASKAFFDVAHFPDIVFSSTDIEKVDDRTAKVTGDLTILGLTHPLVLMVTVSHTTHAGHEKLDFHAKGTVHRLEYGLTAGFPAIGNDIHIDVTSAAVR